MRHAARKINRRYQSLALANPPDIDGLQQMCDQDIYDLYHDDLCSYMLNRPMLTKKEEKMKTNKKPRIYVPPLAHSLMSGVAWCHDIEGGSIELIYTDGTREKANTGKRIADYDRFFSIVSDVQSHARKGE